MVALRGVALLAVVVCGLASEDDDCKPGLKVCAGMGETCGDDSCCTGMGAECGANSMCTGIGTTCGDHSECSGIGTTCGADSKCIGLGATCGDSGPVFQPMPTMPDIPAIKMTPPKKFTNHGCNVGPACQGRKGWSQKGADGAEHSFCCPESCPNCGLGVQQENDVASIKCTCSAHGFLSMSGDENSGSVPAVALAAAAMFGFAVSSFARRFRARVVQPPEELLG